VPQDANWLQQLDLSRFVSIDLETTGLDPSVHEIIEIGAVRFVDGLPADEFQTLIRPRYPLDPFITELTGITDADLEHAPPFDEVAAPLLEYIGKDVLVGQNLEFDLGFLRSAGEKKLGKCRDNPFLFVNRRAVDTVWLARIFWAELSGFSLKALAEAFEVTPVRAHRAKEDAYTAGSVLVEMLRRLPTRVWSELAEHLDRLIEGTNQRSRFFFRRLCEAAENIPKPRATPALHQQNDFEYETDSSDLRILLGKDGLFEERLAFFRERPAQIALAKSVDSSFNEHRILLAEAPTGVGKSLAYLVPSLNWIRADTEGERQVVVSSHTKVLQEQLLRKDIGEIRRALGGNFRAAVLKGRNNYLCKRRLHILLRDADTRLSEADRMQIMPLLRWSDMTATGDISEIGGFNPRFQSFLWSLVCSDSLACAGSACSAAKGDFYRSAQDRAAKAQIVFVNHALLMVDFLRLMSGGQKRLILDEAHQIERAMVNAATTDISTLVMRGVLTRLVDEKADRGLLYNVSDRTDSEMVGSLIVKVRSLHFSSRQSLSGLGEHLVGRLRAAERTSRARFRFGDGMHLLIRDHLADLLIEWLEFSERLNELVRELANLRGEDRISPETMVEFRSVSDNVLAIGSRLSRVIEEEADNEVTWVEYGKGTHGGWCSIHTTPVSVGQIMKKVFWPQLESAVLTSATLTVNNRFAVTRECLGLDDEDSGGRICEISLDGPFNLQTQMRTFVPTFLPEPRQDEALHAEAVSSLTARIVEEFSRGTLVLCTSNEMLERITAALTPVVRKVGRRLLSQWSSGSLPELVAQFRRSQNAILVGAASLWEGIDVVGDALQILIVTRIPFDVPSDPWFSARCEALQAAGRDPFMDYTVPMAALRLKQGIGRLIRHTDDRGIAVLMDPRIFTSGYGGLIRSSLPSTPRRMRKETDLFTEMNSFWEGQSTC